MKGQVARAGAGLDGREGRIIRHERGLGRVEPADHHLVQAEVAGEGEPIAGVIA